MTAPSTLTKDSPVRDWLEALRLPPELDTGDLDETNARLSVAMRGVEAGLSFQRFYCTRCKVWLNWLSTTQHLQRTETSHRYQEGAGSQLHQPGDIRPASPAEQPYRSRWTTSYCRSRNCGAQIVWARTASGALMPVNARPDPAGNVVLSAMPGQDEPLAIVLRHDAERAEAPDDAVHATHFQTCPAANTMRRRSTR